MKIFMGFRMMVFWMANSVVICRSSLDDGKNVLYLLASLMFVALVGLFPRS